MNISHKVDVIQYTYYLMQYHYPLLSTSFRFTYCQDAYGGRVEWTNNLWWKNWSNVSFMMLFYQLLIPKCLFNINVMQINTGTQFLRNLKWSPNIVVILNVNVSYSAERYYLISFKDLLMPFDGFDLRTLRIL